MDDWKDGYVTGSFRGIPFRLKSHAVEGGRRKQDREFAKRDIGNSEDLGKKLKKFRLELHVIGDDYFAERDALEAALEEAGPGELIHPYRGALRVQAGTYTLIETDDEGRIARFNTEFTEAGEIKFPEPVEDDLANVISGALALIDSAGALFEDVFSVVNSPAFVVEAAEDVLTGSLDFAENAVKAVTAPVASFTNAISNIKAAANDLVKAPDRLAAQLTDAFEGLLGEFIDEPETSERIFAGFSNLEDDDTFTPVVGDTPSRATQQNNQDALLNFTNQITLANQAQAAVEVDFESTSAALASRNAVVEGLDKQLSTGSDDLFQDIQNVQTSLVRAIPRTGTSELITIVPPKTIPAIVIAHSEFEDLEKEIEIVDENAIEHPGFVPGGDPIRVSAG